jgi:hypothetical protein
MEKKDKENFLKPTKNKILSVLLIGATIIISNIITQAISRLLIPKSLINELLTRPMSDVMMENINSFMIFGFEMMAINLVVFLVLFYLCVCIIFRMKK